MASKVMAGTTLFISFNLLFFASVSSHNVGNPLDNPNGCSTTNSRNPVVIRPGDMYPQGKSSRNPLNLGVCANLLGGLVDVELGNVPTQPCCSLIQGLVDLKAAICLCTAIRANVLGIINLNLPISLSLLLNDCGMAPSGEYLCSP
ncbi:hypothetical protein CRYUN_Cryun05aG0114100 [Craigia yunnanensis]